MKSVFFTLDLEARGADENYNDNDSPYPTPTSFPDASMSPQNTDIPRMNGVLENSEPDYEKFAIRALKTSDYAAVHEMFISQHVALGTMRIPYQSTECTFKRLSPSDNMFKLVACVGDIVLGYAELETFPNSPRYRHAGEINMIVVHFDWQRRGIGRSLMAAMTDLADNWLQLNRLSLLVWESNYSAITLYQQCGFEVEGTLKNYVFSKGELESALTLGRVNNAATYHG